MKRFKLKLGPYTYEEWVTLVAFMQESNRVTLRKFANEIQYELDMLEEEFQPDEDTHTP